VLPLFDYSGPASYVVFPRTENLKPQLSNKRLKTCCWVLLGRLMFNKGLAPQKVTTK
jgi:hypothetical protein